MPLLASLFNPTLSLYSGSSSQSPPDTLNSVPEIEECPSCRKKPSASTYRAGCVLCRSILCSGCRRRQVRKDPVTGAKSQCLHCHKACQKRIPSISPNQQLCKSCHKVLDLSVANFDMNDQKFLKSCRICQKRRIGRKQQR
jgi:hypothetical protein